jgi:hypothetical protein
VSQTVPVDANVSVNLLFLQGEEVCDDWWPLSGQEGEGREGMLHLVLSMQVCPSYTGVFLLYGRAQVPYPLWMRRIHARFVVSG